MSNSGSDRPAEGGRGAAPPVPEAAATTRLRDIEMRHRWLQIQQQRQQQQQGATRRGDGGRGSAEQLMALSNLLINLHDPGLGGAGDGAGGRVRGRHLLSGGFVPLRGGLPMDSPPWPFTENPAPGTGAAGGGPARTGSAPAPAAEAEAARLPARIAPYLYATPIVERKPTVGEDALAVGAASVSAAGEGRSLPPFASFFASAGHVTDALADDSDGDDDGPASGFRARFSAGRSATLTGDKPDAAPAVPLAPTYALPTSWNPRDRCSLLELHANYRRVAYIGSGRSDSDAASVRANAPMPAQTGAFYFEVRIVNKGRDGYIGIGFCAPSVSLNRLPGWEPNSWGYHGDDGHSFACSGTGRPYGPTFGTGDVVGCGIDFSTLTAFFTKNGVHLGTAFRNLNPNIVLFPAVGLRTPGETVEVNFGQQPFVFDMQQYFGEQKARLWAGINAQPLPGASPAAGAAAVQALVLEYLIHHSYADTARQFCADCNVSRTAETLVRAFECGRLPFVRADVSGGIPELDGDSGASTLGGDAEEATADDDEPSLPVKTEARDESGPDRIAMAIDAIRERDHVRRLVLDGDSAAVLALVREKYPQVAATHPALVFALRSLEFLQLVAAWAAQTEPAARTARLDQVVRLGRTLMAEYDDCEVPCVRSELAELFSLLAYADPHSSPVGRLLRPERRDLLAEDLNGAILAAAGKPADSALARVFRQAAIVRAELVRLGIGSASFVSLPVDVLGAPARVVDDEAP